MDSLTLEQKASLCSGADFWNTKAILEQGVQNIMVSDGPHGLRKQIQKINNPNDTESVTAICFPSGSAFASSFDRSLINLFGSYLGEEASSEKISILLGPAINIKRTPLCGRNFEYLSEDPYLSGQIASEYVKGLQSKNVGACLKHFAANNQEYRRFLSDSIIDERTLHEIYLYNFEQVVREAKPWSIMCSYNKINGKYSSENYDLLTKILRDQWGFNGCVISDWGAVNDRVKSLKAGLDLEMPSSNGIRDKEIVEAIKNNELDEAILNTTVKRLLELINKSAKMKDITPYNKDEHHDIARKIENESAVLLKNSGILPLKSKNQKICFVGKYAKKPRYQGGGSSHIKPYKITNAYDIAIKKGIEFDYIEGFNDEELEKDFYSKLELIKKYDVCVIFAGLPDKNEVESIDRADLSLPKCQNDLISLISKQTHVVIVLHNGSPIIMPWINEVDAVLEMYLGGEAIGESTIDLLFGFENPSGHLAETFPLRLCDNPSYLTYHSLPNISVYGEGIYVGYRYYDKKEAEVLFPFGHGLSYTKFEYSNLKFNFEEYNCEGELFVYVDIQNIGTIIGKEVVQLYIKDNYTNKKISYMIDKPIRELKQFEKIQLLPNEKKTIKLKLNKHSFSYYNVTAHKWIVNSGIYTIEIGSSSRDIRLTKDIKVKSQDKVKFIVDKNTPIGDIELYKCGKEFIQDLLKTCVVGNDTLGDPETAYVMINTMLREMPLKRIISFGVPISEDNLDKLIIKINMEIKKEENEY